MSKSRFAIGAIVGAVAGIVAGVLTAPKSGRQTRADIKDKAAELKREAARRGEQVKTQSEEVVDGVRNKIEEFKKDHDDQKGASNKR